MKLDFAWNVLKQFVEPELQVLAGQQGTQEVWTALRTVESALSLPAKLPRPRGWVSSTEGAFQPVQVPAPSKTIKKTSSQKKATAQKKKTKKTPVRGRK